VLLDAGPIARIGAPIATTLADLAGALTIGGAVVAGWLLRERTDRARALGIVAGAAAITTLTRGASLAFSYAIATGQPVGSERFGSDLGVFIATELGVWLLVGLLAAAATTTVAVLGTSTLLARTVAVLASVVAFTAAMTGHAAGDETHEIATSTMLVHLLAVGIWLGGLAVLQVLPGRGRDDVRVLRGYSHLALICWIALALSGVLALAVRMNTPAEILTSAYVQIGLGKAVLLLLLGLLGALQRRQLETGLGRSAEGRRALDTYRRLALLELALMGLAVALAAAMSSSPPPAEAGTPPAGTAGTLTGYPLPPAPDLVTTLTQWRPDPFGLALACVLILIWWRPSAPPRPRARTVMLVLGAISLVLLTSGPLNVYSKVLLSAHVLQHVLLLLPAGVLLGCAATAPSWLRTALSGRWPLAALAAAAGPLLIGAVYLIPPALRIALDSHAAHLALQMLALAAGALIALAARLAPASRRALVVAAPLLVSLAGGIALRTTDVLLAASWFGATGRTWRADALADQRDAGTLVLIVVVLAVLGLGGAALRARRRS
jgi:putative copper export protein/cytochrome c oxidase assembly factor CtaG